MRRIIELSLFALGLFLQLFPSHEFTSSEQISIYSFYSKHSWNISTFSGRQSFQSDSGDKLALYCYAPFPVKWAVSGRITPLDIIEMRHVHHIQGIWLITCFLNFTLMHTQKIDWSVSAEIKCEKYDSPQINSSVFVFVVGNQPTLQQIHSFLYNSKLIPCATTNPSLPTHLFFIKQNQTKEPVKNLEFNPTIGFSSNSTVAGIYECSQGSVTVTFKFLNLILKDLHYSPMDLNLRRFTDEAVNINCLSKSRHVLFAPLENLPNITLIYHNLNDSFVNVSVSAVRSTSGVMACVSLEESEYDIPNDLDLLEDDRFTVRVWKYSFYDPPKFRMSLSSSDKSNFEGQFSCNTDYPAMKQLLLLECKTPLDCELRKACVSSNVNNCWLLINNMRTISMSKTWKHFATISHKFRSGLALCKIASGPTRVWEYFLSLEGKFYFNWRDAPSNELVRFEPVQSILYLNQSHEFTCTALSFLFVSEMQFELEFDNGTFHLIQDVEKTGIISFPKDHKSLISNFNIIGLLLISLPHDAVAVHCRAIWWNSTDYLTATSRFKMRSNLTILNQPISPSLDIKSHHLNAYWIIAGGAIGFVGCFILIKWIRYRNSIREAS